uniref:Protein 3 n=1 Tax=Senecio virus 1 TaxID=2977988 RepID=A0A9N6YIY2_9RHAB|nr:TPA_asm: protein 3 [Senecio virus 1]
MSMKTGSDHAMFSAAMMDPEDKVSGSVFDPYAPSIIPSEKIDFAMKWSLKSKGNDNTFDFGKIPVGQAITNKFKGVQTLNSVEIHVVWKSHVPPTEGQDNVSISLLFTPYAGYENKQQVTHTHPTHLHMHHIFYPRNSCNIVGMAKLPWAIDIHVEGENYVPDYVVADVYVRLMGYAKPVASYPEDKDSELISIVPMSIPIEGIRLSKPRRVGDKWKAGSVKRGTSSEVNAKKMIVLQQMGVDLEGATMMNIMDQLLKAIPRNVLTVRPDSNAVAAANQEVNKILKTHARNYME